MHRIAALLAVLLVTAPAAAREVAGLTVPDRLTLDGAPPLVLNGAGVRKKLFVEVYVGALYLAQPDHDAQRIIDAGGPRAMRLAFLREVDAGRLAGAWSEGVAANHGEAERRALDERLARFNAMMRDVRRGDVLRIDLVAGGQTRVLFNDQPRGSIDGADFQRALLRVWLGERPADAGLKRALLAGAR